MKIIKLFNFQKIVFFISFIFLVMKVNLYYPSTLSPDFVRYKSYIEYFMGFNNFINSEQGSLYFFIIFIFIFIQVKSNNLEFPDNLNNIGNQLNFNFSNISQFEYQVGLGIQYGNIFIYLFGLFGIYKLLRLENVDKKNIFLIFTFLNFLPTTTQMILTLKPEIFAFSLLIWSIYFFEQYFKDFSNKFIYLFLVSFALLATTKASILGMVLIFFFFKIKKTNLRSLSNLKIIKVIIILFLLTSIIFIENSSLLERSFFDRAELNEIYNQVSYDNKATFDIFFRINFNELIFYPVKNYHANSLIGITLLDTFGDYFNEYWNKDYTFYSKFRKDFIQYSNENTLLLSEKVIKQNLYKFNLDNLRRSISLIQSLIFYFFIFYFLIKKNYKNKLFVVSPLIGIFILTLSSLGFPENNFDPITGDLFKSFYYSFFICLSFIIIINEILSNVTVKKQFYYLSIFILINLFVFGFPKGNNTELDTSLIEFNRSTITCELNKLYLKHSLIEYKNVPCINQNYFNNLKISSNAAKPYFSIFLFLYLILQIFIENTKKYFSIFKLNQDKRK